MVGEKKTKRLSFTLESVKVVQVGITRGILGLFVESEARIGVFTPNSVLLIDRKTACKQLQPIPLPQETTSVTTGFYPNSITFIGTDFSIKSMDLDKRGASQTPLNGAVSNFVMITSTFPDQKFIYGLTADGKLKVLTKLDFSLNFCRAVSNGYKSCGYIADTTKANNATKPSILETIENANSCISYFTSMDTDRRNAIDRKYLYKADGCLPTKSISNV